MLARVKRLLTPRFSLKSILVLVLGIAIGYSLNLYTLRLLLGPGSESAMVSFPTYVIEPPDRIAIRVLSDDAGFDSLRGEHLVTPDGRISLGEHGSAYVTGMTIEEATEVIRAKVAARGSAPQFSLAVVGPNSKRCYVITKGLAGGDNITQLPITGNDTVLDALAQVGGVNSADTKIYISRPSAKPNGAAAVLPVNYEEVVQGVTRTNYQLLPGDRVFVEPPVKATPAPRGFVAPTPIPVELEQAQSTS